MTKRYSIWDCRLNADTKNFGGLEWVVDGERGRAVYPGTWPDCMAKRLHMEGLNELPEYKAGEPGYCDGCIGAKRTGARYNCTLIEREGRNERVSEAGI